MTNEKAIEELSVLYERYSKASENRKHTASTGNYGMIDGQYVEAIDLAIKALEQTSYKSDARRWKRRYLDLKQRVIKLEEQQPCEDCISREAIYEALSEWDEQDVYLPYHFKELVAELPSVTPWSDWIPVSEKLPEPLTAVLLTVRYKSSGCLTYQMGYWEDTLEKWEKWIEIGTLDDEFEILAWMELPEKYEEGEDE